MKTLCTALCALALATLATAATLTTSKGVAYQDYKVTAVEKEAVRIVHRDGTATIVFDELPPLMRAQYGWTAEKSEARNQRRISEQKQLQELARLADADREEQSRIAIEQQQQVEADKLAAELAEQERANASMRAAVAESERRSSEWKSIWYRF